MERSLFPSLDVSPPCNEFWKRESPPAMKLVLTRTLFARLPTPFPKYASRPPQQWNGVYFQLISPTNPTSNPGNSGHLRKGGRPNKQHDCICFFLSISFRFTSAILHRNSFSLHPYDNLQIQELLSNWLWFQCSLKKQTPSHNHLMTLLVIDLLHFIPNISFIVVYTTIILIYLYLQML